MQGYINQANQRLKEPHRHIFDIDGDDEDEYSDTDIYVSDTDGNDNVNDNISDVEANDYQQGDQLGRSRGCWVEDSRRIW